mmetsp:Transcript_27861/g.51301  ORF Transcript_27861/g.51301 Transcript_27861/m.51301 type:complete len:448 (+) Transcript_27861:148-1491(+)
MPPDFVIRISLVRDETSLAELKPPVWRRFTVSSAVNLELLHDKILAPVMGWERNYHTYYFYKGNPSTGTFYVQQDSQASDAMHIGSNKKLRGATLKPEDATIGDLLKETGDKCVYNYDLGDCFYHSLELETIVPDEESDGKVTIIDGAMRCPNEDGDGSLHYQAEILDPLLQSKAKPYDDKLARKFAWDCFKRRGGLNVNGPFRPEDFDLEERQVALSNALGSRNSTRNTTKTFSAGAGGMMGGMGLSYARIGQCDVVHKKEDDRFDHMGGFITMHETQNRKPDLKDFTLCYQCGSPNDLKSCGRCHAAFYCSRDCQTKHWSSGGHKKLCKKEKAAVEKYEKELASNKPDPNRFNNDGGVILMKKYDPEKLRFKVGDKVECMIGPDKWGTGRIVKLMYREPKWPSSKPSAPYQIKLDRKTADREGIAPKYALIYSDWDDDLKIRRLP